jgi:hypothetical protein
MAEHIGHCHLEAGLIVHVLAVVVAKRLLIEVTEEMERFDAHVSTVDTTLQQRPEVLKAVRVDAPVDVLHGVIDNLVGVLSSQTIIGEERIGVESRASLNMLLYFCLEGGLLEVCNNHRLDLAATLKDAHNSSLVFRAGAGDATGLDAQVHVAGLTSDESLIGFDFASHLDDGLIMHRGTDAVKHEPSRLLGDAESTGYFAGANAVLAIAENPVSAHPLVESKGGILEDRSYLEAELLLASRAKPDLAGFDEGVLFRSAPRAANQTIREAQVERVLESAVGIREVDDCFLQCVRGFHKSNSSPECIVCQVCNCPDEYREHLLPTVETFVVFWSVLKHDCRNHENECNGHGGEGNQESDHAAGHFEFRELLNQIGPACSHRVPENAQYSAKDEAP